MIKQALVISALSVALSLSASHVSAQEQQPKIYGSQLMTEQERREHRAKMRAAKTEEERERIRKEHHERMKQRAKAQGITLPVKPPARGRVKGPVGGRGR